jgi:hypothetical protein
MTCINCGKRPMSKKAVVCAECLYNVAESAKCHKCGKCIRRLSTAKETVLLLELTGQYHACKGRKL